MSEKLNKKLEFYQEAYNETNKNVKNINKDLSNQTKFLEKTLSTMVDKFLGEELSAEERIIIENDLGVNLIDLDKKFKEIKIEREKSSSELKEDPRTQEYLNLVITTDLDLVLKMEDDDTFNYLINENFHNNQFLNEPYFELLKFKYQPRFWKFKDISNKKAKEFGFENYKDMFDTWNNLRITYKSLIGDKRVEDVVKEAEEIKIKINNIESKIINISNEYLQEVKDKLTKALLYVENDKLNIFGNTQEIENIILLKEKVSELQIDSKNHSNRMDMIMSNISKVEELLYAVENGSISTDDSRLFNFFANNDPSISIHQLITDLEWSEIKNEFSKKGIELKEKGNYTKVETKITNQQKESLLNKYNVQEGEIFIDENIVKRESRR